MPPSEQEDNNEAESIASDSGAGSGKVCSIQIFKRHMRRVESSYGGPPVIDASGLLSRACFEDWLSTRGKNVPSDPEKTFQRCLTAHVTSSDGRRPFSEEEEKAVLKEIRVKRVWPAFTGTNCTIGIKGFRSYGFHEKSRSTVTNSEEKSDKHPRLSVGSQTMEMQQHPQFPTPQGASVGAYFPYWPMGNPSAPEFLSYPSYGHSSSQVPRGGFVAAAAASSAIANSPMPIMPTLPSSSLPSLTSRLACVLSSPLPVDATVTETINNERWLIEVIMPALIRLSFPDGPPPEPTAESAQAAIDRFLTRHAGFGVLIINPFARSLDSIFLAQSESSIQHLGAVAKSCNGSYVPLIEASSFVHYIRHTLHCLRYARDKPVELSLNVRLASFKDAPEQRPLLKLVMEYDSEHRVICMGGKI